MILKCMNDKINRIFLSNKSHILSSLCLRVVWRTYSWWAFWIQKIDLVLTFSSQMWPRVLVSGQNFACRTKKVNTTAFYICTLFWSFAMLWSNTKCVSKMPKRNQIDVHVFWCIKHFCEWCKRRCRDLYNLYTCTLCHAQSNL